MTIHVSKDTGCNLGCSYCYEEPDREINENDVSSQSLDTEAVIAQLEQWKEQYPTDVPGLHGGEPLLIDTDDLEVVFKWVYDNYESVRDGTQASHIQTNGTLIKERHIDLFKQYNVAVGISCDGPVELNRERLARPEKDEAADGFTTTDSLSQITNDNITRLASQGVSVGIIVVIHETNAGTDDRLETLLDWMDDLAQQGVTGHYNPALPYDEIQTENSLSGERLKEVYLRTYEWMKEEQYREWNPMSDARDNLLGNKLTNCVNNRCDVFNAGAAKIVTGEGETTGCGKTWGSVGDGVPFLQGPSNESKYDDNEERYEMLQQVPGPYTDGESDLGGCKGCKYWNVCQGGCPSGAIDQDFRNRTRWCPAKYAMYEAIENDMRTLFPNITLITDYPWNAELAKYASKWGLDIKPFAAMDPGVDGPSSVWGGYSHPWGGPLERVPDDVFPDDWRGEKEFIKSMYDEEVLEIDENTHNWHADSDMGVKNDDGWEQVDEETEA